MLLCVLVEREREREKVSGFAACGPGRICSRGRTVLLHFVGLERSVLAACLIAGLKTVGLYLKTKTAGGVKVDFFAPCVRARHLELGHFSRREQEGRVRREWEIEMGVLLAHAVHLWICPCITVVTVKMAIVSDGSYWFCITFLYKSTLIC